jgi:hypothetical protein
MYPSRSSPPPPLHRTPLRPSHHSHNDGIRIPDCRHPTIKPHLTPTAFRFPCVNTKNVRLRPRPRPPPHQLATVFISSVRFCPPPPRPFSPPGTLWVPGTAPGKRLCICLWQYFSPSVFPISVVITRGAMRRMWGQPSPHRIRSLHYPWTLGSIYVSVPTVPFPWSPSLPQSPLLLFG